MERHKEARAALSRAARRPAALQVPALPEDPQRTSRSPRGDLAVNCGRAGCHMAKAQAGRVPCAPPRTGTKGRWMPRGDSKGCMHSRLWMDELGGSPRLVYTAGVQILAENR